MVETKSPAQPTRAEVLALNNIVWFVLEQVEQMTISDKRMELLGHSIIVLGLRQKIDSLIDAQATSDSAERSGN